MERRGEGRTGSAHTRTSPPYSAVHAVRWPHRETPFRTRPRSTFSAGLGVSLFDPLRAPLRDREVALSATGMPVTADERMRCTAMTARSFAGHPPVNLPESLVPHALIVAGIVAAGAALVVALPVAAYVLFTTEADEKHARSRRGETLEGLLMALFGAGLLSCMTGIVLERL